MSGIRMLALLTAILGIAVIAWGLLLIICITPTSPQFGVPPLGYTYLFTIPVLPLIAGFCLLLTALGIWNAKKWGFWLGVVIYGILIVVPLLFWTEGIYVVLISIVPMILLICLISQKEEFK